MVAQAQDSLPRPRGLLVDLDGVVYIGERPIPGAAEFFARLRERGVPFVLITNNSTQTPAQFVEKLARMGIRVHTEEVLSSAEATGAYLARVARPGARVYLIGEAGLRAALAARGFQEDERRPEVVAVGLDRAFDYRKLTLAIRAVQAGAQLIGANPDVTLPTEEGDAPGSGAFLAAISAATGVQPTIVGKPEPTMLEYGASQLGLLPAEVGVVGDRLDTDILGAKRAGMVAILVLTGVASQADLERSSIQPDLVVDDLPGLGAWLLG
ncbi:MAG: HAD-IIA family hydrolase [Chloroflexi bacterium]|nr:HAD-IIA family hydrolase [Chloroflexota bacterium]